MALKVFAVCWRHVCKTSKNVSEKESQTRIYGILLETILIVPAQKYIDLYPLRSGNQKIKISGLHCTSSTIVHVKGD